ncbi:MAG: radical SAM protein [Candidatus Delongbacteria bacterium]|jgi:uncharacterized protein|nr:radical SAM protein [Candidatus Delongbacteria bacterium]MDD4204458.1 radical SAM protein [Candidatus Delongbacteria bacterium]
MAMSIKFKRIYSYLENINWSVFSYFDNFYFVVVESTTVIPIHKKIYKVLYNLKLSCDNYNKMDESEYDDILLLIDHIQTSNIMIDKRPKYKRLNVCDECNVLRNITIEITENCNLECKYCYGAFGKLKRTNSVKKEDVELCVDSIFRYPKLSSEIEINFFGGEPLLEYEKLKQFVKYIEEKKHNIKVQYVITTNGTLINREIVEFLKEFNFYVLLSCDGIKNCNDQNRIFKNGMGSFETINKNVINLIKNKIPLKILMLITPYSSKYFASNLKYFDYLGVKVVSSSPFYHSSGINISPMVHSSEFTVLENQLKKYCLYIIEKITQKLDFILFVELRDFVKEILYSNLSNDPICMATNGSGIYIDYKGNIYPCPDFKGTSNKFLVGNTKCDYEFSKINKYIKIMKNTRELPDCKNCLINNICTGLCLSQHIRIYKKYQKQFSYYSTICNFKISLFKASCFLLEKLNKNQLQILLNK